MTLKKQSNKYLGQVFKVLKAVTPTQARYLFPYFMGVDYTEIGKWFSRYKDSVRGTCDSAIAKYTKKKFIKASEYRRYLRGSLK